jgi:enamine deaminase RidA (YjgF/YER057c/UK114 family)
MNYNQCIWHDLFVKISWSTFKPQQGDAEFYAIAEILQPKLSGQEQLNCIEQAIVRLQKTEEFRNAIFVWKRYFVSDAVNQHSWLQTSSDAAVSIIQQPPLNQTKFALWAYAVENTSLHQDTDGTATMKRSYYTHLYNTGLHENKGNSYEQTQVIFETYVQMLSKRQCTLEANCLRTWLYVQNIDREYGGMVRARKELFAAVGLTPQTHFIASTGIEGLSVHPEIIVMMDAYAIQEIECEQIRYLHASSNMNPTHEYGVTFERGTCIQFGDRRHILISGTASIDNQGKILHPMQLEKQTGRVMENIQVLLAEAEAALPDVTHLIVYLRDIADYANTRIYFEKNYPEIPYLILLAPVCRPGWLIEVECIAIKAITDCRFKEF